MTLWGELVAIIERHYPKGGGRGRLIWLKRMLRMCMHIAQNCFGLPDKGIEDAIYYSQAIRCFVGIDLGREAAPDATTLFKFRRLLAVQRLNPTLAVLNPRLETNNSA